MSIVLAVLFISELSFISVLVATMKKVFHFSFKLKTHYNLLNSKTVQLPLTLLSCADWGNFPQHANLINIYLMIITQLWEKS